MVEEALVEKPIGRVMAIGMIIENTGQWWVLSTEKKEDYIEFHMLSTRVFEKGRVKFEMLITLELVHGQEAEWVARLILERAEEGVEDQACSGS